MGTTPSKELFLAARRGDVGSMEAAIRQGGDVNVINEERGETPLVSAAKHGHRAAVEYLLSNGALDHVTAKGTTALFEASRAGHLETAAALLDRGADFMARSPSGERPIDAAAASNNWGIARLIEVRTSPFAAAVYVLEAGLFGFGVNWQERWLTIARARPWDDPRHDRLDVLLTVFSDKFTASDQKRVMDRPRVTGCKNAPDGAGGGGIEMTIFSPVARLSRVHFPDPSLRTLTIRCDVATAEWLLNVLGDEFANGVGPAFEMRGGQAVAVRIPHAYAARAACFATNRVNAEVALGNFRTRVFDSHSAGFSMPPGLAIAPPPQLQQLLRGGAAAVAANTMPMPMPVPPQGAQVGGGGGGYPAQYNNNPYQIPQQQQQQQPPYSAAPMNYPTNVGFPPQQPYSNISRPLGPNPNHVPQPQHQAVYGGAAIAYGGGATAAVATVVSQQQRQQQQQQPPPPTVHAYHTGALAELIRLQKADLLLPRDAPEPPSHFLCIITSEIMLDPVVSSDGSTYSRDGITTWMARSGPGIAPKSPLTNEPLDGRLVPNTLLRGQIIEWVEGIRRAATENATATAAAAATVPALAAAEAPPSASAPPPDIDELTSPTNLPEIPHVEETTPRALAPAMSPA